VGFERVTFYTMTLQQSKMLGLKAVVQFTRNIQAPYRVAARAKPSIIASTKLAKKVFLKLFWCIH